MFTFVPQFLIIISIVGIIVIVLRRTPEVTGLPIGQLARRTGATIKKGLAIGGAKLWEFVLEVKEVSKKGAVLKRFPQSFPKNFPKFNFPAFRRAAKIKPFEEDYAASEARFIKIIESDPHNEQAFSGLAKLYLSQDKAGEAVETYRFLVKHHPDAAEYHEGLGLACHAEKQFDKAVEAFERAIELAPQAANYYMNLALSLQAEGHVEEAVLNYRRAADLDERNTQFLFLLSEALIKKGQNAEAGDILERILKLEPTNYLAREKLMHIKY